MNYSVAEQDERNKKYNKFIQKKLKTMNHLLKSLNKLIHENIELIEDSIEVDVEYEPIKERLEVLIKQKNEIQNELILLKFQVAHIKQIFS